MQLREAVALGEEWLRVKKLDISQRCDIILYCSKQAAY